MAKLALFDINGTLTDAGVFMQRFPASVKEVFGVDVPARAVDNSGKTDRGLSIEFALAAGVNPKEITGEAVNALLLSQERYFVEHQLHRIKIRPMEGAAEVLERLEHRGHLLGVVTGNTRFIAELQLQKVGLLDFFKIMAAGDNALGREELIGNAVLDAGITSQTKMTKGDVVYVCDTPNDVRIGRDSGALVIGVANGKFSVDELKAAAPEAAFPNLLDLEGVVRKVEETRIRIGRGDSLWMVIPEPAYGILKAVIDDLSQRYSMPSFQPHLTIAGPVADRSTLLGAASQLSQMIPPLEVTFERVEMTDGYFRQLRVTAQRTQELEAANITASRAYGSAYKGRYTPHASLVYAYYPSEHADELIKEHRGLAGLNFVVEKAEVVATTGPLNTWHKLDEIQLKGRRVRT